jgi:hypothetical protein
LVLGISGEVFRLFKKRKAATLAEKVEEKLASKSFDIIFFAVLDNSTYSALAPTGDIIPARRDNAMWALSSAILLLYLLYRLCIVPFLEGIVVCFPQV